MLAETPEALALRFWVADTGIGIGPAEQGHIFEAFAQASADTSRRFGGTGLTISQQLVEQMGGALALRSAPGQGSTFSFELRPPPGPFRSGRRQQCRFRPVPLRRPARPARAAGRR